MILLLFFSLAHASGPIADHYASTVGKTCSDVFGLVTFDDTLIVGIAKAMIGIFAAFFIYRKLGILLKRG